MTAAQRRASGRPSPARSTRTLAAVVLAAGRGKRLKSARPKVLHEICGRAILWHALRALRGARPDRIVVVVSDAGGPVEEAVRGWGITPEPVFVEQTERLGTGHAVSTAERAVGGCDDVLVMAGRRSAVPARARPGVAPRAPQDQGRREHPDHGPRRSERLREDRPGRSRGAARDRRGARRLGRGPGHPRGGHARLRVPARGPVPCPSPGRAGEPAARVLPAPRVPDPAGQGRAPDPGADGRRRCAPAGELPRGHRPRGPRDADADPRGAHGGRRHGRGSRHHVRGRRRPDRGRHDAPSADVPAGRHARRRAAARSGRRRASSTPAWATTPR